MKLQEIVLGFLGMPALSKREVFALAAMKEVIAHQGLRNYSLTAKISCQFADALLVELAKEDEVLKQEEVARREELRHRTNVMPVS